MVSKKKTKKKPKTTTVYVHRVGCTFTWNDEAYRCGDAIEDFPADKVEGYNLIVSEEKPGGEEDR